MIELLAPAGDLEKLKFAIIYGADAVYIGGQAFGLRARASNFNLQEMAEGVKFAHEYGKKVYLTLNIIPHDEELEDLNNYLRQIEEIGIDAVIVADPGTMWLVKEILPQMEIHLSTQANTTNSQSAKFWHSMGVKRIVMARELSFDEIKKMRSSSPKDLEFEAFIHGAMCMAYSGRCLLSSYMTGRDANRGDCAQPCRWSYKLVEQKRPDAGFEIVDTDKGSYILNSRDLCMIEEIPELISSGISSLKIEGRMKSLYYVSSVVRVYRKALDTFLKSQQDGMPYEYDPAWHEELLKTGNREFTKGFYLGKPGEEAQLYSGASTVPIQKFTGIVRGYDYKRSLIEIEQRNHFRLGQMLEVIGPEFFSTSLIPQKMYDEKFNSIDVAPHAQMKVYIEGQELPIGGLIRTASK